MAHLDPLRLAHPRAISGPINWSRAEPLFAWMLLFLGFFASTGVLLPLLFIDKELVLSDSDMAVMRLTLTPFIALVPLMALNRGEEVAAGMARNGIVVLLLVIATLSIFWSVNPEVTTRRIISLAVFTLYAFWANARFGFDQVMRVLARFLLVCLVGSILMAALFPHLGFMPDGPQLRGLYTHKNGLGQTMVLSVLIFLVALRHRLMPTALCCFGLALALGMTTMVDSATSLGIILGLCTGALVLWWCSLPRLVAATGVAFAVTVGAVVALVIVMEPESVFALLGRDTTLTGRTELWAFAWRAIGERPWLGYGYQAFWTLDAHSLKAFQSLNWRVPNAHSGYLELWLSIGGVGLAVAIMVMLTALIRGLCAIRYGNRAAGEFLVLLVLAYAVHNSSESDLLGHTSLHWVIMVLGLSACPWPASLAFGRGSAPRPEPTAGRLRPGDQSRAQPAGLKPHGLKTISGPAGRILR